MSNFKMQTLDQQHSQASSIYEGDLSIIADYRENAVVDNVNPHLKSEHPTEEPESNRQNPVTANPKRKRENEDNYTLSDGSIQESKRAKVTPFALNPIHDSGNSAAGNDQFYFIAHCPRVQAAMRRAKLPRGARFELARLVSTNKISIDQLKTANIMAIEGPNAHAIPEIEHMFLKARRRHDSLLDIAFAKEIAINSPWAELDQEERALSEGPYEGLGNNPSYPGWYGGKVQFRGHLSADRDKNQFITQKSIRLVLDKCQLGSSCRFTRRFGSWSFIRVKIPSDLYFNKKIQLDVFFRQGFVIWDRVFRACYAKGDNVFLFMTNEKLHSSSGSGTFEDGLSLEGFINWHNPLAHNTNQARLMTKWASRMVLGFSTSVPGPVIEQDCIILEPDIVSAQNSDMTDGCGLSSRMVHQLILRQLELDVLPSAFQFRLSGCKGMSLLRNDLHDASDDDKKIWVRPSQTKIQYDPSKPLDPAMRTIDLLRTPHMRSGIRLSNDVVINLAENGVPDQIFVDLFKTTLEELVTGLTTWDGPDAMFKLWMFVERVGGVVSSRRARECRTEARVRGYSNYTAEELEENPEADDEDGLSLGSKDMRSLPWFMDAISGCPSTLEEFICELLDSGFNPKSLQVLRQKLRMVAITKVENCTERLRFNVEQSCIAFAVPDPYECLGPNEVQIKSSSHNLRLNDGSLTNVIKGPVLVGRDPCKTPCDIRKVNAVEHYALQHCLDVIVFSVQGYRRLIDLLSGGDYDGDRPFAIWLDSIVTAFKNADETIYGNEPEGVDICFLRDKETVGDFVERTKSMKPPDREGAMQKYLLSGLADPSLIGKYSTMHDNAIYTHGYSSYKSRKLAAKFCRVLDAPKTGWRIRENTLDDDRRIYASTEGPEWKALLIRGKKKSTRKNSGAPVGSTSNLPYAQRDHNKLGRFIMDTLARKAVAERERMLQQVDQFFAPLPPMLDTDLAEPWLSAKRWAQQGTPEFVDMKMKDLNRIATHVETVHQKHKQTLAQCYHDGRSFTEMRIETRQDMLRERSREFHSGPSLDDLPTIPDQDTLNRFRASYAYKYDYDSSPDKWTRFPWDMAMGNLCAIKATALGQAKVVTRNFYERYKMIKH
ncbi:RNA-dependent RNA polymerase 1 [Psilocybe cubensis]|uniref:RNA-dependent RNA polymerase n=2 Tax=Psilocybe cubensis TaxID=181762 RepID=A0A8H8CNG2_PSICU|nr:RNA-dependent RNA polymerase 1 [Psilocybe cubensis]KAH9484476.1 RNA-dependent RNA polymerase 1 [Psilocybe cubensis]